MEKKSPLFDSPLDELLHLEKEYSTCTPGQRLNALLKCKREKDKRKIALYAMVLYKDILSHRKSK